MSNIDNWFEERQSAWLYERLAERETDPAKREMFSALAAAARTQAGVWAQSVRAGGAGLPPFRPSLRARLVAWLVAVLGPRLILPALAAIKVRGLAVYRSPAAPAGHPMPTSVEEVGHRHRGVGGGGNLRAAVFGVNDGLVSNTSLILGVAGAGSAPAAIVTAGAAGLLAGALSMAAGEYVSMRSQREMYEYQIGLEREELAVYPEEEAEELALIYNARGMAMEEARRVATQLLSEPEHALDTLAREELGLNPDDLGSPWGAAAFSFLSFTAGALIPLLPFLAGLAGRDWVLGAVSGLAGASLFAVGAVLSLFTGRGAVRGGLRMVIIGGGAGAVAFLIGRLLGVALH